MRVKNKGFSLIEVIITVGILVIVMTNLLGLFIYCSTLAQTSGNTTLAVREAQGKLDEMRDHSYGLITTDYGAGGTPGNIFSLNQLNGKGVIYFESPNPDLLQIKVVVSWKNKDNRLIGEDANLNGILEAGEDKNANGQLDSIVSLTTMIARR